jgi:hypothetical protein
MATAKKQPAKKAAPKPATGAKEIQALRAATQSLAAAGAALAKVVKANRKLAGSSSVRAALKAVSVTAARVVRSVPEPTPPPTTPHHD